MGGGSQQRPRMPKTPHVQCCKVLFLCERVLVKIKLFFEIFCCAARSHALAVCNLLVPLRSTSSSKRAPRRAIIKKKHNNKIKKIPLQSFLFLLKYDVVFMSMIFYHAKRTADKEIKHTKIIVVNMFITFLFLGLLGVFVYSFIESHAISDIDKSPFAASQISQN